MTTFIQTDGGREAAGYKGFVNDCVVRAISIVTESSYKVIYREMNQYLSILGYNRTARQGIPIDVIHRYMKNIGWKYVPATRNGNHSNMHLNATEMPSGRIIADMAGHVSAMIDGVIYDMWDFSNNGEATVLGYWVKN